MGHCKMSQALQAALVSPPCDSVLASQTASLAWLSQLPDTGVIIRLHEAVNTCVWSAAHRVERFSTVLSTVSRT